MQVCWGKCGKKCKKCGRKRCTTNRENRSLMRIVKQNRFNYLGELHKEWTEAGVKASRATTHRRVHEFGYSCHQGRLTWAKEKKNWTVARWSKVLFQMRASFVFHLVTKVLESGGRVEQLIAQVAGRPVWSFLSLMIWGAMSSAGVGPLCFLKTNVTAPVYQEILGHFMLPSADQLLKMLISFSSRIWHLPTLPKAPKLVKWQWCWCAWLASKLTRPEPQRESMGYCQEENEKQETKKNADELKATVKETWASIPPQQCHKTDHLHATPNWGSN